MRFNARHLYRYVLVGGALVALGCAPSGAWAQQNGSQDQTQAMAQGQFQAHSDDWVAFNQFLDAHQDIAVALKANPDLLEDENFLGQHPNFKNFCDSHPKLRQNLDRDRAGFHHRFQFRHEVAAMDSFLDGHPFIEQRLDTNPSLINDQAFVQANVSLRDFLSSNPQVQQAFQRNPVLFMKAEDRFEGSPADFRGNFAAFGQFAKDNFRVAQQLEANPSLINDSNFVNANPSLKQFLVTHPDVQQQFAQNPAQFIQEFTRSENNMGNPNGDNDAARGRNPNADTQGRNPNPDLTQGEVASTDQFLDQHPSIEKQLEANPSLINNPKYLSDHPELRAFLSAHAQVREEFTENPSFFMHQEGRFEATEDNTRGVSTMDEYLDKHHDEARDLDAYPARINDSDYLSHHKDLDNFLKKHPEVREQFSHNPSVFMHQESAFDASAQMDDFLDNHKSVRKDLDQNPESVKNDDYLNHHKDLKAFLSKNPGVGDQFQSNPGRFMDNERKFEANRQMDFYLTKHKNVAKDLQKNPDRVKDSKYLDHHKNLKQIMDQHPDLARAANTNPSAFMQEQMKFHEQYKNQHGQDKTKVQERATTHAPH